jgi:hypothetical protein
VDACVTVTVTGSGTNKTAPCAGMIQLWSQGGNCEPQAVGDPSQTRNGNGAPR